MIYAPLPTREVLLKVVSYNPLTGALTWLRRLPDSFVGSEYRNTTKVAANWNSRWEGKPAFTKLGENGYWYGSINGKRYAAHRVIWVIMTGKEPASQVDHENGRRGDNRWCNLREVTPTENRQNAQRYKNNKSGVTGVNWFKPAKLWQARIVVNGETIDLGYHKKLEDAIAARLEANRIYAFHINHGRSKPI